MGSKTFFDQIVFSGGGTRCLWQGGFIDVLRNEIPIEPARISGLSGGALTCCGFMTRRGQAIRDHMCEVFAAHDRNIPLHEPFDDEDGNSPHQRMYRKIVESSIGDPQALRQIAEGPQMQILIARPPSGRWAKLSGAAMTLVYEADTVIRSNPHLKWAENFGLTGELVDANKAARDGKIVDLICAAATIPPAFEPPLWGGKPAVDAGMVDQAPMPVPDQGRSLILLTKRFRDIPQVEGRVYVCPSESVAADKIDFTDPEKLRDTWRQGEEDARRFLADGLMND
ncbi:patatin-like phospholipase family protein [Palleronia pontilimi]|uniref:patatin-like phospholipase family protein n=1 Tax=Palleronia pontilimi TaxID=1964209 RepID=UPI0034CD56B5